ncbi:class I SAM-dependent methyltransferase [Cellulosimicrobium sp. NPDC057127]|uniref:class I SAM-dependent methyltransferase n=1 Tax=Cellulosimicrobium sp. NPDC057127 TaxID=3346026 RepID=UPI003641F072
MATTDRVRQHYAGADLAERILAAASAGGPVDVGSLAPYDQLHVGGAPTTLHLLRLLGLEARTALLDVGCGLGGPARIAADRFGCPVTGVDLSPDFVAAGSVLTEHVGLSHLVRLEVGAAEQLPCEDASQDRAMMIHVGMNVPDKTAAFAELHRVVRPGGLVGVHDQMRVGPGELTFPLPWAVDAETSFVEPPSAYEDALSAAGFAVLRVEDRRADVAERADEHVERAVVFGATFLDRVANLVAAARGGVVAPVVVVACA